MRKALGIIQARVGSQRLPGKVLKELNGQPAVYWVVERARQSRWLEEVVLATSHNPKDDTLATLAESYGWSVVRGNEDDVLSRFATVLEDRDHDLVARINADNFAIDPHVIDHAFETLLANGWDICSPFIDNTYPFGVGAEVSTASCLRRLDHETKGADSKYREHIYFAAYDDPAHYNWGSLEAPLDQRRPDINVSVDTEDDFATVQALFDLFRNREKDFRTTDIIKAWPLIKTETTLESNNNA